VEGQREGSAVGEVGKGAHDVVEVPVEQHGIREVGVVQRVGVRLQRRDALLLEARPELAHQPLAARVEQETHGERHATQHSTPYRHPRPRHAARESARETLWRV